MKPEVFITVASILFGFLFAGFWWALNRELTFPPDQRHFKFGYLLLLLTMAILAILGVLLPLRSLANNNRLLISAYRAVLLATVGTFGYMLTELGHYSIFQRPKYTTWQEHLFFWSTLSVLAGLALWWWVLA